MLATPRRVLLIDRSQSDRDLLALALRNELQQLDVVTATNATEFAVQLAGGKLDVVVLTTGVEWSPLTDIIAAVKRIHPRCVVALFTAAGSDASAGDAARVVDAAAEKTSEGYLALPAQIRRCLARDDAFTRIHAQVDPQLLVDAQVAGGFIADAQGTILYAASGLAHSFAITRQAVLFQQLMSLPGISAKAPQVTAMLTAMARTQATYNLPVELGLPEGRLRAARLILKPLPGSAGYVIGALIDEAALLAPPEPRATEESKEQPLPYGHLLSHDLQQPLQNVVRQAKWLLDHSRSSLSPDAINTATHIRDSAERMQEMIDGALLLTRIDAGPVPMQPVGLNDVLRQTITNLEGAIAQAGAQIDLGNLPTVRGNFSLLVQLMQNLISNAIKFRGTRPPYVKITGTVEGDKVLVRIADNGIGIRLEDQARIFDLFRRLHTDREYPGTGLGLAICKRVVDLHHGSINVDSMPGQGSTFNLELPTAT